MPTKSISTITTGLMLIAIGVLTQKVLPVWARIVFQSAGSGSFRPEDFQVDLLWFYAIAGAVITLGGVEFWLGREQSLKS